MVVGFFLCGVLRIGRDLSVNAYFNAHFLFRYNPIVFSFDCSLSMISNTEKQNYLYSLKCNYVPPPFYPPQTLRLFESIYL
jgi:hypothetical protein